MGQRGNTIKIKVITLGNNYKTCVCVANKWCWHSVHWADMYVWFTWSINIKPTTSRNVITKKHAKKESSIIARSVRGHIVRVATLK